MLYAGTPVAIEGCVDGWSWCDVASGDSRGWVPANYLQQEYQGQRVLVPEYGVRIGIPVITFVFGSYWDSYYSHRSWYGNRERWSQVRPQYETLIVNRDSYRNSHDVSYGTSRGDSHTLRTRRTLHESSQSGVVATQPSYQGRPANTATTQHSGTAEVRSSENMQARQACGRRAVETRAVVQRHSRQRRSGRRKSMRLARQVNTTLQNQAGGGTKRPSGMIAEHKVAGRKPKKGIPAGVAA